MSSYSNFATSSILATSCNKTWAPYAKGLNLNLINHFTASPSWTRLNSISETQFSLTQMDSHWAATAGDPNWLQSCENVHTFSEVQPTRCAATLSSFCCFVEKSPLIFVHSLQNYLWPSFHCLPPPVKYFLVTVVQSLVETCYFFYTHLLIVFDKCTKPLWLLKHSTWQEKHSWIPFFVLVFCRAKLPPTVNREVRFVLSLTSTTSGQLSAFLTFGTKISHFWDHNSCATQLVNKMAAWERHKHFWEVQKMKRTGPCAGLTVTTSQKYARCIRSWKANDVLFCYSSSSNCIWFEQRLSETHALTRTPFNTFSIHGLKQEAAHLVNIHTVLHHTATSRHQKVRACQKETG